MAALLIVDDDQDMADLLSELLRSEGHEVRVAHDGAEGLAAVHGRAPDVILADVEMPVLTGPEMARAMLVHDLGLEKIPIVLASGVLDLPAVAAAVGTPYYLAKPYSIDALSRLLARVLEERQAPYPQLLQSAS
jgi:CheY-like chemotaxis protein